MAIEVLCIGHAAVDLSVQLDSFPLENSKCEIRDILTAGGGPAANAAYLLSKWGIRCAFAGLVGKDSHGQQVREELEAVGTDVSLLEQRPGYVTPFSIILVNKQNGSRTIANRKFPAVPIHISERAWQESRPIFCCSMGMNCLLRSRRYTPFRRRFRFSMPAPGARGQHSWPGKWIIWPPHNALPLMPLGLLIWTPRFIVASASSNCAKPMTPQ